MVFRCSIRDQYQAKEVKEILPKGKKTWYKQLMKKAD
jgi:hypothetical protein